MSDESGIVVFPEYVGGTLLGQQVGDYYVSALHAQGPIADIYLADEVKTKQRVCIKVIPSEFFKRDAAYSRLKKRIEIVSRRLSHPAIDLPVAHSVNTSGLFLIFSRYRQGRVLKRLIRKGGALKEKTALTITKLAAAALLYAHGQGIIHGNLKPSNLLLTPKGSLVILDWASPRTGLLAAQGRIPDEVIRDSSIDQGIAYVAPELVKESDDVSPTCDVFSLGAVLCYLLSGRPPFEGRPEDVKQKVAYADVPDVIDQIPGIKVGTAKLILKMMSSDSDKRYKNLNRMIPDMDELLGKMA